MARILDAVVRSFATIAIGGTVGAVLVLTAPGAGAQISTDAIPAEFPPASYTANQYVDSEGCAFIRAGISGAVTWVPRVSRDRNQLCGFQPTFASAPPPEPVPAPAAPVIEVATPAPAAPAAPAAAAPAPAPVRVSAPTPARPRNVGAPTETVASLVTPPTIGRGAPAAAAVPEAAPEPEPVRQAEACAGLTGVQPNLINVRTGDPIDCGPGPRVAAAAPTPAPMAEDEPLRMTRSEACARMEETGQTFIDASTGGPLACPSVAPVVVASAAVPMAPSAPVAPATPQAPAAAASAVCPGMTYVGGTTRYPVRCGPQTLSPSGVTSAVVAPVEPHSVARAQTPLFGAPVPASNPVGATIASATVPQGYEPVWEDGRVNPQRGVPRAVAGAAIAQPQSQPATLVSTRAVPQAVAAPVAQGTAHRYVQVGTYGEAANAERAVARLRGLGLPVGVAQTRSNGRVLQIVAAGPFADAGQLQAALRAARSAGYGDAFTRR